MKKLKKLITGVLVISSMTLCMTGISVNADEISNNSVFLTSSNDIVPYSSKLCSYSVGASGGRATNSTFTITSTTTIKFCFNGQSIPVQVSIINSNTGNEVYSFIAPKGANTICFSITLPAGTYYCYITPINDNFASGSFSISY